MPKNNRRTSVRLMYLISFLQGMVFYGPIATLYRTAAGVTIGQIALIESISFLLMLLLELPWGLVTARIGYKNTLLASCTLYFVSKIIFWQAATFSGFLMERILLSIVLTGFSGCDTAYLYLCAGEENAQQTFGRCDALGMAGLLTASAFFSGFLGEHYRLAALLTIFSYGAAALTALFLFPVPLEKADQAPIKTQLQALSQNLQSTPQLLPFLLSSALLTEVCQLCTVFFSQPLYQQAGMPESFMGLFYILTAIAGMCGALSHRVIRLTGEKLYAPLLCITAAALCALLSRSPSGFLCGICVVLLRSISALFQPYAATQKNRSVNTGARSVLLSGYAMIGSLTSSAVNYALGQAANWSLERAVAACGAMCLLAAWGLRPQQPR